MRSQFTLCLALAVSAQAIAVGDGKKVLVARLTPLQAAQQAQGAIAAIASISSGLGSAAGLIKGNGGSSTSSGTTTTTSTGTTSSTDPNACTSTNPQVCYEQALAISSHNNARAQYGVPALTWDPELAAAALKWATNCEFKHSGGTLLPYLYGENLYANSNPEPKTNVGDAVGTWMAEAANYNYNNPGFGETTGHFTQVVWKSTTKLGCAVVNCDLAAISTTNPSAYIACEYSPPGNFNNAYAANVLPHV